MRQTLLIGILVLAGLATTLGYGPYLVLRAYRTLDWPEVSGAVTRSEVIETRSGRRRGTKYEPVVEYRYQVAGQSYDGSEIWPSGTLRGDRGWADKFARERPVDAKIPVYHDPDNPADAVLIRGETRKAWFTVLFGVVMLGAGLFLGWKRIRA